MSLSIVASDDKRPIWLFMGRMTLLKLRKIAKTFLSALLAMIHLRSFGMITGTLHGHRSFGLWFCSCIPLSVKVSTHNL